MSNKIKILGSIVTAAALWLGTTAYISSNTETYLKEYTEKTNTLYEEYGMQFSVQKFEKGFFTSDAKMKLDFSEQGLRDEISKTLKLPIEVDYKLENGPLFFKNGLAFGTSRVTSKINLSEYFVDKEAFKKIFKNDIEFTSSTSIDFSNNASFKATSNEIIADIEGNKVHASPLNIEGEVNVETFEGTIKMLIDSLSSQNETSVVNAEAIVLDGEITKFYDNGFYLGNFVLDVGKLSTTNNNLPFTLDDAKISLLMNIDENEDKTIDMKFKLKANVGKSKLPKDYETLNKVELSYALNGTKLEGLLAFQDFTKQIKAKQQELLLKLASTTNGEMDMNAFAELEKFQLQTQEEMVVLLAGLLKKERTNLDVSIKMVDNNAKESNFKMNMGYMGDEIFPSSAKEIEKKFKKELFDLISIDLDVSLDKAYISNLPVQFQQELAGQLQMGTMFGIVKENNNSYSFDATYKSKSLMVNGQNRSEMLEMLEMGISEQGLYRDFNSTKGY